MMVCWKGRNRSAEELINRGGKPRVNQSKDPIHLVEDVVVHPRPGHDTGHASSDLPPPDGSRNCTCEEPCDKLTKGNRAGLTCRTGLVAAHFRELLKPTADILRHTDEILGSIEPIESISDSDYPPICGGVDSSCSNCSNDINDIAIEELGYEGDAQNKP